MRIPSHLRRVRPAVRSDLASLDRARARDYFCRTEPQSAENTVREYISGLSPDGVVS